MPNDDSATLGGTLMVYQEDFLLRDRDGIYGDCFQKRVKDIGIEEVLIAPRASWQNRYCERVIGSIRRECLNHLIVPNKRHPGIQTGRLDQ